MKFSGKVGNGPTNKRLNFGDDPRNGSRTRSVSQHWWQDVPWPEVCTVPVLLVPITLHRCLFVCLFVTMTSEKATGGF